MQQSQDNILTQARAAERNQLLTTTKAEIQKYQVQLHELKTTKPGRKVYQGANTGARLVYLTPKKDVETDAAAKLAEAKEGLTLLKAETSQR